MLFQLFEQRPELIGPSVPHEKCTDFALTWDPGKGALDFSGREAILFRLDSTLRKLNSRCLGMLECFYYPGETASILSVPEDKYEPPLNSTDNPEENLKEAIYLPLIQDIANIRQHKLFPVDFVVEFLHRSLGEIMINDGLQLLSSSSTDGFDSRNFSAT